MTWELLLFGLINIFAGVLSGASGGGGGLITTPLMVLLGLSPAQAIATAKFGGLGVSIGASRRFYKEKITDRRTIIVYSILGAAGALAGSLTLVYFQEYSQVLEKLMGLAILILGVPLLYLRNAGLKPQHRPQWIKVIVLPLLAVSVFLQAVLSSGIGSLQMILFISGLGMTALTASATRRAMQLTIAIVALSVVMLAGLVDYTFGVTALVTSLIGGYLGAHVAIKRGNKFVINIFAVVSVILALQLILQ